MTAYELKWPADFDEYAWEVESKGWFSDVTISARGRSIKPAFYDPSRLEQEIADEIADQGLFSERDLIVLEKVTKANIENAIEKLASSGKLEELLNG
jgi:hypothetical protein